MSWYTPPQTGFGSQVNFSRPAFTAPVSMSSTGSNTMPGPLATLAIPAAIAGGSQIVGAAIGGKGSNRAAQAQERAQREALDFQKSESAKEEARHQQNKLEQIMAWNDYNRTEEPRRRLRAEIYGYEYVPPATIPPDGWTAPVKSSGTTLGQLAGGQTSMNGQTPQVMDAEAPTLGGVSGQSGPRGPWAQAASGAQFGLGGMALGLPASPFGLAGSLYSKFK